ncbi:DUF6678 family protein [Aquimarina litoralis]|uniref:DUF6678 family protein n=1 Tax=Aquimarina litoralis TaxID=584605 RepID=UPI001C584A4F|nr:DUF6678 family protein [Aquimarina litoralis]MBW1294162.1 hypothetical protein [Aquimarina litoralis]
MTKISKAEKHQQKLEIEIARKASFMNTTKWKALFSILTDLNLPFESTIKLLLDAKTRAFSIPNSNNLINEKYIEEYWGVFELKEIEWILISLKNDFQKLEQLEQMLQEGKQFEYETSEAGLKIYGYK